MKKCKKTLIVISLLLIIAIMEIANIIPIGLLHINTGATVQAYTHNPNNILNNVYEENGLTILPFIFDNPNQTISKSYIIEQFKQAGINIKNQESLGSTIVTGNEIKTDNKTYTVLIFGDVDQNGIVNSFDALSIIEHIVYGGNSEIKGICKLAANVENNSDNLDSFDALRIIEFVIGREKKLVLNEPASITNKEIPKYEVPTGLTATKGQTLADVKLPAGFKFAAPLDTSVGEIGTNIFTVIYTPEDTNKYEVVPGIKVSILVTEGTNKEIPIYVVPKGLEAIVGQTLADIALPDGFSFEDPLDTLVGEVGDNIFKVTYTPEDTDKYEIVKGIELTITVKESSVEDPEKITGIKKVENDSETQISQDIYNENRVATIKSIDDEIMLAKDSNFIYSCDIITNNGNKETAEVTFSKGTEPGEINVNFYATKAGTYILSPKVSGRKVNGTVKLPAGEEIRVTVNEYLTVTDIKLDGKLLPKPEDVTTEATIAIRVERTEEPKIEFYHIYDDNKYKTKREVKIENMLNTPVELLNTESCKTYLGDIALCSEDKKVVVYNAEGKATINPYCINMMGILETPTICSFDIKVSNINDDGTRNEITRTVNVSVVEKSRSKDLKVGVKDISLYKNYPGSDFTDTIIDTLAETYKFHVVKNTDNTEKYRVIKENNKSYAIIPIELIDEFGDKVKITKEQIERQNLTNGNKLVVLGNDNKENVEVIPYIDVKAYASFVDKTSGETVYYKASNENDSVKAIGVALENSSISTVEESIEDFNTNSICGFKISYNGLDGTGTSAKVVRKTTDLIKATIDETNNSTEDNDTENENPKNVLEVGVNNIALYKNYPGSDATDKIIEILDKIYKYHVVKNTDGTEKYRVVKEDNKVYTIVPIELFDELGKETKIEISQISFSLIDNSDDKISENNVVILGNNSTANVEVIPYIDIKPYSKIKDEKSGETIYYKAKNENDSVKAIGIALETNSNVSSIEDSISDFNYDSIIGFIIGYNKLNETGELERAVTELISAKIDEK